MGKNVKLIDMGRSHRVDALCYHLAQFSKWNQNVEIFINQYMEFCFTLVSSNSLLMNALLKNDNFKEKM